MKRTFLKALAVTALGADPKASARGLADWRPYKGRGGVERIGGITLIDDSYNANPGSLIAAIDELTALHSVDIQAAGLESFGKGEGYVRRQVEGWSARYRKARTHGEEHGNRNGDVNS